MTADPRIEAAAIAIASKVHTRDFDVMATAALAAADNAATITTAEDLLSTRAGLALANTAYGEGARDMLRECNSDDPVFTKPMNPYSGPLLRMIRESRGTE